jgi:phage terminase small subunit
MGATNRQKMFADYFLETGNAEQSAIRAGCFWQV